jgi:polar amino acid transport system substrate-binding protein
MRVVALGLVLGLVTASLPAQDKTVVLTSLEWPPYTSASLPGGGAAALVAAEAFRAMGYQLKVTFLPWNRAVEDAKADAGVAGYFPEYDSVENRAAFAYSDALGSGPLGFVERKDAPVAWTTLADLQSKTIGVVNGYINTEAFDAMVAKRQLRVDPVVDDATNVVKVANGRMPLAVIDRNVLTFLVNNDKVVIPYRGAVQFNARILEDKKLFVCFKKGKVGEEWAKIFNEGLKKINAEKILRDGLATQLK